MNLLTHNSVKKAWIFCRLFALCFLLGGCNIFSPEDLSLLLLVTKDNCWACSAYKVVWEAIGDTVQSVFPHITVIGLNTLGVGLLFWIAFNVGKLVVAVKEPNLKEFITGFAAVLFKSFVVAVILMGSDQALQVLDMFITPIITSFVSLSTLILFSEPTIATHFAAPTSDIIITADYPIFTAHLGSLVEDVIYRIYVAFNSGMALGGRIMLSVDFVSQMTGLMVILVFFYMMLLFPMLFLESFIHLGAITVLFPLFLVAWVFPATKSYIKTAWDVLFQAMAQILITCIYIGVLVTVIKSYSSASSLSQQLTDPALLLGIKNMSNNGLAFFALIYSMFKLSNDIPKITSFFVGEVNRSTMLKYFGRMQNVGMGMGKMVAGAALIGTGVGAASGKGLMQSGVKDTMTAIKSFAEGPDNTDPDGSSMLNRTKGI